MEFGPAGILVRGTKFPGKSGPGDRIPQFSATEIMVRQWPGKNNIYVAYMVHRKVPNVQKKNIYVFN